MLSKSPLLNQIPHSVVVSKNSEGSQSELASLARIMRQAISSPPRNLNLSEGSEARKTDCRTSPINGLGEELSFTVQADGSIAVKQDQKSGTNVHVKLSRPRKEIKVVGWTIGSMLPLQDLQHSEVDVAGLHPFDPSTGESNLSVLKRSLNGPASEDVTFATWAEELLVRRGNSKSLHAVAGLAEPGLVLPNGEEGAGTRLLLNQQLRVSGIDRAHIKGTQPIHTRTTT